MLLDKRPVRNGCAPKVALKNIAVTTETDAVELLRHADSSYDEGS